MVNGMALMLAYLASEYLSTGRSPQPTATTTPIASPYGLFRAKDGDIAVAPAMPEILARFMKELGLADVLARLDMKTAAQRRAGPTRAEALIDQRLSTDTQDHWIERLNAAGVPCGKVLSVAEVFEDPQVKAQEMVIEVDQGPRGIVRMVGFPVKLSDTPARLRHPSPELGAHTDKVLAKPESRKKRSRAYAPAKASALPDTSKLERIAFAVLQRHARVVSKTRLRHDGGHPRKHR